MNITRNKKQKIGKNKRNTIKRSSKKNITLKRRKKNNKTNKKRVVTGGGSNWNPITIYKKRQDRIAAKKAMNRVDKALKTFQNSHYLSGKKDWKKLRNVSNNVTSILESYNPSSDQYKKLEELDTVWEHWKEVAEIRAEWAAKRAAKKAEEEAKEAKAADEKMWVDNPHYRIMAIILDNFRKHTEGTKYELREKIKREIISFLQYLKPKPMEQQTEQKIIYDAFFKMYNMLETHIKDDGEIGEFLMNKNSRKDYIFLNQYMSPKTNLSSSGIKRIMERMRERINDGPMILTNVKEAIEETLYKYISSDDKRLWENRILQ
jgi:hypothetical protein